MLNTSICSRQTHLPCCIWCLHRAPEALGAVDDDHSPLCGFVELWQQVRAIVWSIATSVGLQDDAFHRGLQESSDLITYKDTQVTRFSMRDFYWFSTQNSFSLRSWLCTYSSSSETFISTLRLLDRDLQEKHKYDMRATYIWLFLNWIQHINLA